ncbi:MAG: hypothetical protein PHY02_09715 [Phycisphaerae bacterium]|nr:hypothetical protein [Phycisphaerae bacterium]
METNEIFKRILDDVEELKDNHMRQADEFISLHDIRTATIKAQEIFKRNGSSD